MVNAGDLDDTIADMLVGHLFERVCVKLRLGWLDVLDGRGERWVDAISRELRDALFVADCAEVITVDAADAHHFLVVNGELLELASVLRGVGL